MRAHICNGGGHFTCRLVAEHFLFLIRRYLGNAFSKCYFIKILCGVKGVIFEFPNHVLRMIGLIYGLDFRCMLGTTNRKKSKENEPT